MNVLDKVQHLGNSNMNVSVLFSLNCKGLPELFKSLVELAPLLVNLAHMLQREDNIEVVRSESVSLDTKSLLVVLHDHAIFANLQEDHGNVLVPEDSNVSMVGAKNLALNTKTLHEALLRNVEVHLLKRTNPMEFKEATSA